MYGMARYVLGISCYYHDASATLLKDGRVVAAAEEERFTRIKHDISFPNQAISWCLKASGIELSDVGQVAFYEKPMLKMERILSQHLVSWPRSYKSFVTSIPAWFQDKLRIPSKLKKLGYGGDVLFVEHHLAHAASAFLPSPYERAAIVTADGVGEWATMTFGVGYKSEITLFEQLSFPHSIGLLYSTITAYLGFSVNNSEYKVMGLGAYGDRNRSTNKYYEKLRSLIDLKSDGSFRLDMRNFAYQYATRMPAAELCDLLGGPIKAQDDTINSRHKDIAAAVQLLTEDVLQKVFCEVALRTGEANVVLAGGVALNSVYNGKILANTPFERVWIQPNASDGGTSMGAALHVDASVMKNRRHYKMNHAYLGPSFSGRVVERWLKAQRIVYTRLNSRDVKIKRTAKLIANNKVVGWFQGAMEWGPRALGARSILANASNLLAQDLLNRKVKHRELFRPFAPAVCLEDAATYFEIDDPLPEAADFMLMVYPVRVAWRRKLPAITHVDGSGRLQSVRREQNRDYYDLIKEVGAATSIPVIINTSFNIRGEPIVCTPGDAYRCMMGTGIDYLIMEDFLIARIDNPRDMWDSERLAVD